jgi:hypothetical protein
LLRDLSVNSANIGDEKVGGLQTGQWCLFVDPEHFSTFADARMVADPLSQSLTGSLKLNRAPF